MSFWTKMRIFGSIAVILVAIIMYFMISNNGTNNTQTQPANTGTIYYTK